MRFRNFDWLWHDQSGQDLTEYALLLVLVALACITSIKTISNGIKDVYSNAASNLLTT
jgi:Flp pilus assembly pilin Flp